MCLVSPVVRLRSIYARTARRHGRKGMMMTEPEKKILGLLAKEWQHSGPPGILDIGDIVNILDLAPSVAMQAIKSLYQNGLIDMNRLRTSAFLTPGGYDQAVKAL